MFNFNNDKEMERRVVYAMHDFLLELTPHGYIDVRRCVDILNLACIPYSEFIRELEFFCDDIGISTNEADLVGFTYHLILQKSTSEILKKTGTNLLYFGDLQIDWNYYCTSYNFTDSEVNSLMSTFAFIQSNKVNASRTVHWFMNTVMDLVG
jgi:hypothetical protein